MREGGEGMDEMGVMGCKRELRGRREEGKERRLAGTRGEMGSE